MDSYSSLVRIINDTCEQLEKVGKRERKREGKREKGLCNGKVVKLILCVCVLTNTFFVCSFRFHGDVVCVEDVEWPSLLVVSSRVLNRVRL